MSLIRLTALLAFVFVATVLAEEIGAADSLGPEASSLGLLDQLKLDSASHFYTDARAINYCATHSLGISEFDTMTLSQRNNLYSYLVSRSQWRCMKDAHGANKYYGLPEVTKKRVDVKEIFRLAGVPIHYYINAGNPFRTSSRSCRVLSLAQYANVNYGFHVALGKMSAWTERGRLQKHIRRVYRNKLQQFSKDGRTQLACEKAICFEMAYAAIYAEYTIGVMLDRQMVHKISRQQILTSLGIYDEHIAHVSKLVAMGVEPDEVWKKHMAGKGESDQAIEGMYYGNKTEVENSIAGDWEDGEDMDAVERAASCHPVCKLLAPRGTDSVFRYYKYISYKACCNQCPGTWCRRKTSANTLVKKYARVVTVEAKNGGHRIENWGLPEVGMRR